MRIFYFLILMLNTACVTMYNGANQSAQAPKDYWVTLGELRETVTDKYSSQPEMGPYFGPNGYVGKGPEAYNCPYSLNKEPVATSAPSGEVVEMNCLEKKTLKFRWESSQPTRRFAELLHSLAMFPFQPEEEAAFQALAKRYREVKDKPQASSEVRFYKVGAETAVREKRLDDAVVAYRKALQIDPTWPPGRFNIALVYGELGLFEIAVAEMNKYLLLVPGANNAQIAQDKVYEWQSKIK
jgi:tetratricopeptide (TPR) repeat protein